MSDQPKPTYEEREAQRLAAEDTLRQALAAVSLDGPFSFPTGGDFLSAVFSGGTRGRYAICLRCGAMVVLDDPEERPDGSLIERGVRLHTGWHEEVD